MESYNLFFEKDIYKIFKENNPLRFVKETQNEEITPSQKTGEYEMEIYFGGKQGDRLYFGKPVIYDTDKEGKYMYPNEARLRNMTYAMSIRDISGLVERFWTLCQTELDILPVSFLSIIFGTRRNSVYPKHGSQSTGWITKRLKKVSHFNSI